MLILIVYFYCQLVTLPLIFSGFWQQAQEWLNQSIASLQNADFVFFFPQTSSYVSVLLCVCVLLFFPFSSKQDMFSVFLE